MVSLQADPDDPVENPEMHENPMEGVRFLRVVVRSAVGLVGRGCRGGAHRARMHTLVHAQAQAPAVRKCELGSQGPRGEAAH